MQLMAGQQLRDAFASGPLLAGLFIILCRPWKSAVMGLGLSRMLVPAYLCGALLAAAASLLWHAEEKAWIARDTYTKIEPGIPAVSRSKGEVAEGMRAQWIAILEGKPQE